MPAHRSTFTTIRTEGAILPADLLQRIAEGDAALGGLTPEAYHLAAGEKINEAINRAWNRCLGAWATFQSAVAKLAENDLGTSITRERWLLPLFQELGYGRLVPAKAIEIEGKSYAISHGWQNTPIHLVGLKVDLDRRTPGVAGASRSSPHSLVQELLNRSSEHQWGIVSNGLRLRVLRDNARLTRQAYVEFDLQAMMDGEVYADFAMLWLVGHQSRFEIGAGEATSPLLEKWMKAAQDQGTRALDQLRGGVEAAITALGTGFITPTSNRALREKLQSGALSAQEFYRQLQRMVYRLIFLFTAEERGLLLDPKADPVTQERYTRYYSIGRLRRLAERRSGTRHVDVYHGLRLVMDHLGGDGCPDLALPALGSDLFNNEFIRDLEGCEIANRDLLAAIRALAFIQSKGVRRLIDYKNLGSQEWGSVYTSLLELHPILNLGAGTFELQSAAGNERKTTGSYYTEPGLVNELVESALEPVIADRLSHARTREEKERALLSIKVCDFSSGSGHMLLAAGHRLARHLAIVRSGDEEPSPEALRTALRDVIGHCLYGVDINPLAVELCKVNLWMEALEPGKPLSFLDHHIKCGNSLIGATPVLLAGGIPDEAFTPIAGDDKAVCSAFKKKNKQERSGQRSLFDAALQPWERVGDIAASLLQVDELADDTIEGVRRKQARYAEVVRSSGYEYGRLWADSWCAAFVWKKTKEFPYPITEEVFRRIEHNPFDLAPWMREEIERLAGQYQFFHWHLEFPEVFKPLPQPDPVVGSGWEGGFDVLLSNPPWEMLQLEEQQFFAARDPRIAQLAGETRKRAIRDLQQTNQLLSSEFANAKRIAEAQPQFFRSCGRYPLTATGKMNTYALFAELARSLITSIGRVSIIVPTGIATDDTTKEFFSDLTSSRALVSLFDFENREAIFPDVHRSYKFSLLTMSCSEIGQSEFAFFSTRVQHLQDQRRRFALAPDEIALFNPNTRTMPIFRTHADAELTRKIYKHVPVLENERTGENPWGMRFKQGLFNMTGDSGLFVTEPHAGYVPLYEAKMIQQFDHRWATYDENELRDVTSQEKNNARFGVKSRYWVARSEVDARLVDKWGRNWIISYRRIARSTDERTMISGVVPRCGLSDVTPLCLSQATPRLLSCLLANFNSICFDYIVRQKIGGLHIDFHYIKQFPVLPPSAYTAADIDYIAPRVLELVYTAWDLKPFAEDMGYHGEPFKWDEERRAHLRAELDAYYARLYGLSRDELRYVLDPQEVHGSDFPGETFRVLKEKELKAYGEFRTRRLVLEKWDGMEG
ncbi:hypothetical protein ANRL4_02058 [Anaerolineae bacterium]|nr:hypothetical protein ANRL4_02058 [Anaerolineae bacterium]